MPAIVSHDLSQVDDSTRTPSATVTHIHRRLVEEQQAGRRRRVLEQVAVAERLLRGVLNGTGQPDEDLWAAHRALGQIVGELLRGPIAS